MVVVVVVFGPGRVCPRAVTVKTAVAVFPVPAVGRTDRPGGVGEGARSRPGDAHHHGATGAGGHRAAGEREVAPPAPALAVPPQLLLSPLGAETTTPFGNVSVNATPVSAVAAFGLEMVKPSVLVPLSGTEAGLKAMAMDGGAMAVIATGSREVPLVTMLLLLSPL